MEFNLSEAVKYKGSTIQMGFKEGTDEPRNIEYKPINMTFIWKKININNEFILYLIQHEDGETKDWFNKYKASFGETNFDNLHKDKTYIYVTEKDLISLDRPEATKKEEDIPVEEEDIPMEEEDIPTQEEDVFVKSTVNEEYNKSIYDGLEEMAGVNYPHYTTHNCSPELMVETIPLIKVYHSRKMTEPFTIEVASGEKEKARAGDFLMLSPEGDVFIEPKETFSDKYQIKQDVPTIVLGKKNELKTYILDPKVDEYIKWLEKENENLRTNLYLK